jgi:catechol 2,3-dioxygenase-like lactoylglutathione lyase family enzyme
MKQELAQIALLVRDYDEAIRFFTEKLAFELKEDTPLSETKRWVVVCPKGSATSILLARAVSDQQLAAIGNQSGGRVFLFLHTDDLERDYQQLILHQIKIVREPETAPYGKVLVFEDLYGNLWDLIQPLPAQE